MGGLRVDWCTTSPRGASFPLTNVDGLGLGEETCEEDSGLKDGSVGPASGRGDIALQPSGCGLGSRAWLSLSSRSLS